MLSTLAAMVVALAATSSPSDGDSANRVRASIYDIVRTNQAARLGTDALGETRAYAPAPSHRSSRPVQARRAR